MGNGIFGGRNDDEEEEAAEQKALGKWRPELIGHGAVTVKKKSQATGEDRDLAVSIDSDDQGSDSSVSQMEEEKEVVRAEVEAEDEIHEDKASQHEGSHREAAGSDSEDGFDPEEEAATKRDEARRRKKIIVRMEFEPLLSLHEPLGATVEEPAEIFSVGKGGKRNKRLEEAALEDANVTYRAKSKAAAERLMEMGLEECSLAELAIGEDPNELRFALEQSKRFVVDDDLWVEKTLVQKVMDVMETDDDIVPMTRVLNKLGESSEAAVRLAVRDSLGELKIRFANDIEHIERVDPEEEQRAKREQEKVQRAKEKMEKKKELQKRSRRKRGKKGEEEQEAESESSDEDGGPEDVADKKALAFRRLQVQIKIEEFLKAYTRGQNLVKINAKGRRYARRVYVDTSKRALVIQGANGPKFFPFASMKEVDLETRTTKEGRVETIVICAIEKDGRIVKELTLAFPDQSKAPFSVEVVVGSDVSPQPARVTRSSLYREDDFELGHSQVWGSWYDTVAEQWGYACCRKLNRSERCTEGTAQAVQELEEGGDLEAGAPACLDDLQPRSSFEEAELFALRWLQAVLREWRRQPDASARFGRVQLEEAERSLAPLLQTLQASCRSFWKGEEVHVWSVGHNKWIKNGRVLGVKETSEGGRAVGSVLVSFEADSKPSRKWVSPANTASVLRKAAQVKVLREDLDKIARIAALCADREYHAASQAYLELTVGHGRWHEDLSVKGITGCAKAPRNGFKVKKDSDGLLESVEGMQYMLCFATPPCAGRRV
ncbi:SLU7 [Symbiodinium natans]|uniref:SLU7 protein n=1 Tax=Symbiodinium natans TaxID=878477 RepID=A0A812IH08_9DINO|nr:SLU7 [Symbiodinium natans]